MNATKLEQKKEEKCSPIIGMQLRISATPERDYDDNFYIIIKKILGDIIFDYDYIDAREDEVIVNFKLLYGYAALLPEEEEKYKKFTKSIQRRAATIGGQGYE